MSEVDSGMPNYRMALNTKHGVKILKALGEMGGEATFDEIKEKTGLGEDILRFYLDIYENFVRSNIIEKIGDKYRLKHKTTFCWLYGANKAPLAYLGLLGKKGDNPEPIPKTAMRLLQNEGEIGCRAIDKKLAYVLTTGEALNDWGEDQTNGIGIDDSHFIRCLLYEIQDIAQMKRKAVEILEKEEMRNAIVVLDCTGLTKPAGIALYEIARDYFFPLVYVYVKTGKIKWLVSRDYVSQRLTSKPEQDLYEDLLEDLSNRKSEVFRDAMEILRLLGEKGGVAGFNDIASYLKSLRGAKEREPSVAKHLIGILEEHDITQRVRIEGGPYALKYKTPFCWLFGKDGVEYVYFGLLGAWRPPGREIVTKTALNLLKNDGYQVSQIHILTTQSGYDAWRKELDELRKEYQELRRSDILHYYLCPEQEVDDFGVIKRIIEPFIQSLLRDYVVILDGTGLTKPATLAMYELARKYCTPMIYVYEAERRLHWCVSKESISERLGYTMKSSRGRIYRPREGIGGAIAVSES